MQNTYEKIKELSVQAPTSFRLKNSRLVYTEGDSLLQVIKLTETQRVTPLLQKLFPVGKSRYRLLTTNSLRSNGRGLKGLVTSAPKAILSPRGKWLITLDSINLAHLYNLDDSAREHPFFQDYANFIQETDSFSLDMAVFSATDDFLLVKHASQKTYYLFDLRSQSAPTIYNNTVQGVFSPTGRYAVLVSEDGQLMIIDVANRVVCFSGPSPGITDMAFTRQDASLVVVTDQNLVSQENDPLLRAITINTIDLTIQQPTLKRLVADVINYQLFSWAGRVIATDRRTKQTYAYAVETGAETRCPFGQFNAVFVGKTSFVYTRPGQPADKNQYLYDVVSNRIVRLSPLLSEEARVAFYAPPNGPDATLVSLTAKCLNLVDLRASAQRGRFVYQSIPANGTLFVPTSLRVEGSLIKVRRQDGLVFSFLPTIYYNRRSYLNEHIYPQLTNDDERKLGLIN